MLADHGETTSCCRAKTHARSGGDRMKLKAPLRESCARAADEAALSRVWDNVRARRQRRVRVLWPAIMAVAGVALVLVSTRALRMPAPPKTIAEAPSETHVAKDPDAQVAVVQESAEEVRMNLTTGSA